MNAAARDPEARRRQIEKTIYQAALALDGDDFDGFLGLCAPEFRYIIQVYSPEIRRDMVWLDHDRGELETLFRNLPRHNSDHAPLSRHVTVYSSEVDEAALMGRAVSALQVFRTSLDGGLTTLFAVGKIYDQLTLTQGCALFTRRTIRLETRLLGIGSHKPL